MYTLAKNSNNKRVKLCSPTDHFGTSYGDRGWGCGYRNLQMMLSCLCRRDDYLRVAFSGEYSRVCCELNRLIKSECYLW